MSTPDATPSADSETGPKQRAASKRELGKLKIFFGMSAGVGKTYSMLEAAQARIKEGVVVLAGVINTHGRKETEKVLEGIPVLPEKWVKYKDTVFEELDIDRILTLRPQLVLIDELAHTNVPGSKHAKRWQDVLEILDAGIDVYTTVNVQHLESRKDLVENITGIKIRETVPDLVIERATSLELIDLPPPELLNRMKEGKVYLGDQSRLAAENFFKVDNLTALREIALRFTAEKVDHDLHEVLAPGKEWNTRERLMVAVSPAPSSQQLIRSTRRIAFNLDAPWIAVYVDDGRQLDSKDQARLNKYLQLAQELGAEVITTHDIEISDALQRIAQQKNITRIVIGRPKKSFSFSSFFGRTLLGKLEQANKNMDIHVLRVDESEYEPEAINKVKYPIPKKPYIIVFITVIILSLLGFLLEPYIGYKSVGYIYLTGIFVLSLFVGRGPILFAAILSALSWDFLLIPPFFQPAITNPEDFALIITYFIAATIMGMLTARLKEKDRYLFQREQKTENLYEIMKVIAKSTDLQQLCLNVSLKLKTLFPGEFDILPKNIEDQLLLKSRLEIFNQEKEHSAALWAFRNGKTAGWSTDTLPSAEALYFPIKFSKEAMGVLLYYPSKSSPLSTDEMNFLQTVTDQLGVYLERYLFEEKIRNQDYSRQVEKLHGAIFKSLTRGVYAPLEKIISASKSLKKIADNKEEKVLSDTVDTASQNLKVIVDNNFIMTQFQSGFMHFEKSSHSIKQLIEDSIQELNLREEKRPIDVIVPDKSLYFNFDYDLVKLALNNLLINAITYSPVNTPVTIKAEANEIEFSLAVIDQGPGIPKQILPQLFNKFYSSSDLQETIGLGLTVVKSIVDIHNGKIRITDNNGHGTVFAMIFPI
ncbi:MAG: ATP-binding protein [Parachlamydiales bacterium]